MLLSSTPKRLLRVHKSKCIEARHTHTWPTWTAAAVNSESLATWMSLISDFSFGSQGADTHLYRVCFGSQGADTHLNRVCYDVLVLGPHLVGAIPERDGALARVAGLPILIMRRT